ncbi:MAG TPA: hypothetical protein DCS48_13460 [Desulfovibrio sp.]|nr:hypothetical protein [Desulfovibrio sp.]
MLSAGLSELNLDAALKSARREIIFLAPPYGNFGKSPQICSALEAALTASQGASLTVLCLPEMGGFLWADELMSLLRPGMDMWEKQFQLDNSRIFLRGLTHKFPGRVSVFELRDRPNFPVLIIDDQIFFGHFAYSEVLTPDGFWCRVEAPVGELFDQVSAGREPALAADCAAFRIISECAFLLEHAVAVDLR